MALRLIHLQDAGIRKLMLAEFDWDMERSSLYISHRLNDFGRRIYPSMLKGALETQNDTWLANKLYGYFNATEPRHLEKGIIQAAIPETANITLAEDEFNRFYMRALCLFAIANNIPYLIVCQTKTVQDHRPRSVAKLGSSINPTDLLDDLRTYKERDTRLGLGEPNSSLSVKLP